jgi:hypothetical protein
MAFLEMAPPAPRWRPYTLRLTALLGAALAIVTMPGCRSGEDTGSGSPPATASVSSESSEGAPPYLEQRFQRIFVFVSREASTPAVVVWTFRQSVIPDGIRRIRSVQLGWEGQWETLVEDERMTPHNRFPWRMLPGGGVRIRLAGGSEEVRQLAIDLPTRQLEVTRRAPLGDWSPDPSLNLQIHRAELALPSGPLEGFLVESTWSGPRSEIPGPREWAVVIARDGRPLLLLHDQETHAPEGEPARWIAWSPGAPGDTPWPELDIRWTEVTPIERARRNAPTAWQVVSAQTPDASIPFLEGSLETRSFHVDVLPGPGPVFPIRGLYWVEGSLRSHTSPRGVPERVHGFLHHRQPLVDAP